MADIDLIHAGLPWNNPQKITVKADQYISQLVINRGLLNLLSNDYYLDLKTQRINQYIVQLVGPHIADTTIHWTEDGIIDIIKRFLNGELGNYLDGFGLLKDTTFILPVVSGEPFPKGINRIQNIINNCPKNLNGHTAIFALTPVVSGNYIEDNPETEDVDETIGYYRTIGDYSTNKAHLTQYKKQTDITINYKSISLNNFYGGTIILMGNDFFTCEPKYQNGGKSLNTRQTRIFLESIQAKIDDPVPNPLISVKGNGNNNSRAVVSFNNCNCDSYIWNLGVNLDTTVSDNADADKLPFRRQLAAFFPANLVDDVVTGNIRYIVADSVNEQNFNETYMTLRSSHGLIEGHTEPFEDGDTSCTNPGLEGPVSSVALNNDYFYLGASYNSFIQTFFGRYINEGQVEDDTVYSGATICFWMWEKFFTKNINEVPIVYSLDSNGNGYYIGLDKIANITANNYNYDKGYLETTFNAKKRADLDGTWNFWAITLTPTYDASNNRISDEYLVNVSYSNVETSVDITTLNVVPSRIHNNEPMNVVKLPNLNFNYPVSFFGTPDIHSEALIRNVLLFNTALNSEQIQALANQGIEDLYNLSEVSSQESFTNDMKGALYVYNTTSMNVLGCKLSKVGAE